jgi:hypothetical protein
MDFDIWFATREECEEWIDVCNDCDLIAKTREDERSAAVQRVEAGLLALASDAEAAISAAEQRGREQQNDDVRDEDIPRVQAAIYTGNRLESVCIGGIEFIPDDKSRINSYLWVGWAIGVASMLPVIVWLAVKQ